MQNKIVLGANAFISRWPLKPAKKEEFLALWEPLWRSSIDFMNTNTYFVFYGWGRDENELVILESYHNEDLVSEIRQTDKFKEIVARMLDYCDGPMTMEMLSGLENGRSVFDLYPKGPSQVHPKGKENEAIFL